MRKVAIIGAGIAGLQAAEVLASKGYDVTVVEKNSVAGGNVRRWDRLFPNHRKASEVMQALLPKASSYLLLTNAEVTTAFRKNGKTILLLSNGKELHPDAVLVCTGFRLFNAHRKEEYGYEIYHNVITSADLEKKFNDGKVLTTKGEAPQRVAFVHCVGSRDEKVGNTYCSKVCCATAVKQAIEVKQLYPKAEVFCLYMDLRMYDRYFEDLYRQAQEKYGVTFIRGRLSEVAVGFDERLQIKTEDTLLGKPIKLSVDLLVLMAGMEPSEQSKDLTSMLGILRGDDGFFTPSDEHIAFNESSSKGIFLAGACKGPKSIAETIADARSAAEAISSYLG